MKAFARRGAWEMTGAPTQLSTGFPSGRRPIFAKRPCCDSAVESNIPSMNQQQLANGLGWFGIALGAAELFAPRQLGETIGIQDHSDTFQLMGLREIASGVGILSSQQPTGWVWSRVAGDAIDLSLLGAALSSERNDRKRITAAIAAVAGVTVLDVLCAINLSKDESSPQAQRQLSRQRVPGALADKKAPVRKSITINRPAEEVYRFWRDFENLPRFMNHLVSVTNENERRTHWVAKGPAGTEVSWDAELTQDIPNELIAWRSLPGSTVENSGTVEFETATGGRGTIVRIELEYRPPAGKLGATLAKLFGEAPEKQIPVDLQRVKALLETGEIPRTEGQPAGRNQGTSKVFDDFVRT